MCTRLQFPLLLQLKSMEIKHVGGKRTSIKVSQRVSCNGICFTLQLTVLAFRARITRAAAVFPPDSALHYNGEHIWWDRGEQINHFNDFYFIFLWCLSLGLLMQALAQSVCVVIWLSVTDIWLVFSSMKAFQRVHNKNIWTAVLDWLAAT